MNLTQAHIQTGLERACLILACLMTASFALVALLSMNYPFHLEWMEGQSIDVVQRVVEGKAIFTKPTLEYVPFIYTPLYYHVVAWVAWLTGVDFLPGRLVSTLSAFGIGWLIYKWIRREGGDAIAGLIAAGLFFATYRFSGRWLDIARVDSLYVFLTLAACYVFMHVRGWQGSALTALLFTAAFFTKQSALITAIPLLLAGLFIHTRQALLAGALLAVLLLACIGMLDAQTNGWFTFFAFDVPASHGIIRRNIIAFWSQNVFTQCGVLFALSVLFVLLLAMQERRRALLYLALLAGFMGASYAALLHSGSYMNVLIPAHAVLALGAGLFLARFSRLQAGYGAIVVPAVLLTQMASGMYNPIRMIPNHESVMIGERFLRDIADIEGEVIIPDLQFVQTRVGKKSYALGMAAFDIMRSNLGSYNALKDAMNKDLRRRIKDKQFGGIVPGMFFVRVNRKNEYYQFSRHLPYPREYVVGGRGVAHFELYVPRKKGKKKKEEESKP